MLALNKFAMKVVKNHADFLKEFNNNFPCLIIVSIIACLLINIYDWMPFVSVIVVLGINGGLFILYLVSKFLKNKRENHI